MICPCCGKPKKPVGLGGLGTALKPAIELIALARKPLSESTIAHNILKWGTGAINVDGCRIPTNGEDRSFRYNGKPPGGGETVFAANHQDKVWNAPNGRWPANLCTDGSDEVKAVFPDGGLSSGGGMKDLRKGKLFQGETNPNITDRCGFNDSGSAARFFASFPQEGKRIWYSSKAGKDDRLGSKHPTVKPVDLIKYLVRLITPPGSGLCLDLFAGTGTTGEACFREGMRAVLIEQDATYCADIARRMVLCTAGPAERSREGVKAGGRVVDDGPLFGGNDHLPRPAGKDGATATTFQTRAERELPSAKAMRRSLLKL